MNLIKYVELGSIAESLDIMPGDALVAINGTPVVDIMDYMFLADDADIEIEIEKPDGEVWVFEIEKEFGEPLGLVFENPIIDAAKRCSNQCVFCFIDQLPKGMRESLYFKDDDSRLSFLQGNFVTLTNLKDADIDRIIRYRISPINVSVHTVDPELRIKMLGNRFAGNIVERLKRLTEGGITIHAQIVMCPGYNDGTVLTETVETLFSMYPGIQTAAIVPIGLTRHRGGLIEMQPVTEYIAKDTIDRIHSFQEQAFKAQKTRFAFLADEFYLKAQEPMPPNAAYEDYLQFEDGVGMIRKLETDMKKCLEKATNALPEKRRVAIVTGTAAFESMKSLVQKIETLYPTITVDVLPVVNHFFGARITVVGLLTGADIMTQISDLRGYDALLLADSVFRAEDDVTLDDITLESLNHFYKIPVYRVKVDAQSLLDHILFGGKND